MGKQVSMPLSEELDKFERMVSELYCLTSPAPNIPHNVKSPFYVRPIGCPHCKALRLIARFREELDEVETRRT